MLILQSVSLAGILALAPGESQEAAQAAPLQEAEPSRKIRLGAPQLLSVAGKPLTTEPPGFAAPAWRDMDGDGRGDLVVGQFADGKLQVFRGTADGFAPGTWLQAGGQVAQVPGVW